MGHPKRSTQSSAVDPVELANRVKAKREDEDLSLRAAASELGMSAATISRVESGDYLPQRDHLLVLADWVGLSLDRSPKAGAGPAVHGEHAGTLEAMKLHLRADKELQPDDADILVDLVKTAYKRMNRRRQRDALAYKRGDYRHKWRMRPASPPRRHARRSASTS